MPTMPSPVVFVSGMPIATIAAPYSIAGCAFAPPAGNGPCVTGQWIMGSTSVQSNGQPVAILSGTSICTPTGTPMLPISAQTLVLAT
ncbi:hypothetical protein [Paraburkholderia sp. CI3]|uniref:hypothetical protein n=1 Tax=Paraburkholderia sp. CI3 TaxID=2991060 RepID=UPI003D1FDEB9